MTLHNFWISSWSWASELEAERPWTSVEFEMWYFPIVFEIYRVENYIVAKLKKDFGEKPG